MTIDFHFQGQYLTAIVDFALIKYVFVDGMEINILPEMLPVIMKEYRRKKALMN